MESNRLIVLFPLLIIISTISVFLLSSSFSLAIKEEPVGEPNPVAIFCDEMGYEYKSVKGEFGHRSVCVMPNGKECGGWEFMKGKCGQEFSYCAKQGYDMTTKNDGKNAYSFEYAVCVSGIGENARTGENQKNNRDAKDELQEEVKEETKEIGHVTDLIRLSEKISGRCTKQSMSFEPMETVDITSSIDVPSEWDWRDYENHNWMTNIRDQGRCGSCWAHGIMGATEAVLNLYYNTPEYDRDLSEQYLVTNCTVGSGDCCGGYTSEALSNMKNHGTVDESCLPYADGVCTRHKYFNETLNESVCICHQSTCQYNASGYCSNVTCGERCSNWSQRLVKITGSGSIPDNVETIKQYLVTKGPLTVRHAGTTNDAWGHYYTNDTGIQIHRCNVTDAPGTTHRVALVGYNDTGDNNSYWITKNSHGYDENYTGFDYYGFGECGIQVAVYYIDQMKCGDTITRDTILGHNLLNCNETALIIGADNITLDCNNFVVQGDGLGNSSHPIQGIRLYGRKGVTVKNCNVRDFYVGIGLSSGSHHNTIKDNTIYYNENGIVLWDGDNNKIFNNTFTNNDDNAEETSNSIDNDWNMTSDGNDWDDFTSNNGWPYYYNISGVGKGVDWHPDGAYPMPYCGQTLTSSLTLYKNVLNDCPGHGLIINTDDITLNCQGYFVDGAGFGGGTGVRVLNANRITIKNCFVKEFGAGISLAGSNHSRLMNNTVKNNSVDGIYITQGHRNRILGNRVSNSAFGIDLNDASYNNITQNLIKENTWDGAFLYNSEHNLLWDNNFTGNVESAYEGANITNDWNRSSTGNNWDDFENNSGYAIKYIIHGPGYGIDYWPVGRSFPPYITSTPVTDAVENQLYQYDVEAQDPENDTITYDLTEQPDGMTINTQSGLIEWTPSFDKQGEHNVTVEITDGWSYDNQSYTIIVENSIWCGDNVSEDTILEYDLVNCSQGLQIMSDSITLDCDGYSIIGRNVAGSKGVYLNNRQYATIQNCTIADFYNGVELSGGQNNYLLDNDIVNNSYNGIHISYSDDNTIMYNNVDMNMWSGIYVDNGQLNYILSNTVNNNQKSGIYLFYSYNTNQIKHNSVSFNAEYGLYLRNGSDNIVHNNTANNNTKGIYLKESDNNDLEYNTANNNDEYGIHVYASLTNTINLNTLEDNQMFDIFIDAFEDLHCSNSFNANNGSANRNIEYYNAPIVHPGGTISELILCDADNSNINSLTISGSGKNNGALILRTDLSQFIDINSSNNYYGMWLDGNQNSLLFSSLHDNSMDGLYLKGSNNRIDYDSIKYNDMNGITLSGSNNNISENKISNNDIVGIELPEGPVNNTVFENNITNNAAEGVFSNQAYNNMFFHNNFVNNAGGNAFDSGNNHWDDNISNGNYWDNYDTPLDGCNDIDSNGICDAPYPIPGGSLADNFPFTNRSGWLKIRCGDTITESTVLGEDLIDCPNNGLIIDADQITLDCNDHLIKGYDDDMGYTAGIIIYNKTGITIKNCNIQNFSEAIGIDYGNSNYIHNNELKFNDIGLRQSGTYYNLLHNNTVMYNNDYAIQSGGDGYRNNFTENTVNYNAGGILLSEGYDVLLKNIVNNNSDHGISVWFGTNNTLVANNTANNNSNAGIYVYFTYDNNITHNTVKDNAKGILLYSGQHNFMTGNILEDNDHGIYFDHSSNNEIRNNNFTDNSIYGAYLYTGYYGASQYNTFWENNFINNANENAYEDTTSTSNKWNTSSTGNYWDDLATNPGQPNTYIIPGPGDGIDYFPSGQVFNILGDWGFDEGQGNTVYDSSPFHNDGTINGAEWTDGYEGFALYFDGGSDDVTVPHSESLDITNTFYVEARIEAIGTSSYNAILDKYHYSGGVGQGFTLYLNNGKLRLTVYSGPDGDRNAIGTTDLRNGQWHHVAGEWDGSFVRVYVDGEIEAENPWEFPPAPTSNDLGIGKRLSGWGGYMPFAGKIDEVKISKYESQEDPVSINMIPDQDPVIVGQGGQFTFTGILTNNLDEPITTDVWITIKHPDQSEEPIIEFFDIPLEAGETLESPGVQQDIPPEYELGMYEYISYAGDYPEEIVDQASFPFEVIQTITIEMIPDNPPVEVPPGGFFTFTGILNNNVHTQQTTDVWIMVRLPNENLYGPLDVFNNIPMDPFQTLQYDNVPQEIPLGAAPGEYEYISYCGDYPDTIMHESMFPFTIIPGQAPTPGQQIQRTENTTPKTKEWKSEWFSKEGTEDTVKRK